MFSKISIRRVKLTHHRVRTSILPSYTGQRYFCKNPQFNLFETIQDYENRMIEVSNNKDPEIIGGKQRTLLMSMVGGLVLGGLLISNEVNHNKKMKKLDHKAFFKTGNVDLADHKSQVFLDQILLNKQFPGIITAMLEVHETETSSKGSKGKWFKKSSSLTRTLTAKIADDINDEYNNEKTKIKFDYTYTIEPNTLTTNSEPSITVGKDQEITNAEVNILKTHYKDLHLIHIDKDGYFFFVKDNDVEDLIPKDFSKEDAFKKHEFKKGDLKVRLKVWQSGTYTILAESVADSETREAFLRPINISRKTKLFYMTNLQNIMIEDIKLRYDLRHIRVRISWILALIGTYFYAQLSTWNFAYNHYGIIRMYRSVNQKLHVGPTPFLFLVGAFALWMHWQYQYQVDAYETLKKKDLDSGIKKSLLDDILDF